MPFFEHPLLEGKQFTTAISGLYGCLNRDPLPETVAIPQGLEQLLVWVCQALQVQQPKLLWQAFEPEIAKETQPEKRLVSFSGGVDSTAAALLTLQSGYTPVLFYVKGINRQYPNEIDHVRRVASHLNFDYVLETAVNFGKSSFAEHPLKDQYIMAMMADCGLEMGIRSNTSGIDYTNKISESDVHYNFSDAAELVEYMAGWLGSRIPGYGWVNLIKNRSHSLRIICDNLPGVLGHTLGCLTPYRLQTFRRKQTIEKYGNVLPAGRCGVCWKCCSDYLHLACENVVSLVPDYVQYCFSRLRKESHVTHGGSLDKSTDEQVLDAFIDPEFWNSSVLKREILC